MVVEIKYSLATPENRDAILTFIREHFYPEEPMNISVEPKGQDIYDEEANLVHLENDLGTSIIAKHNAKIVGVLIVGVKYPDEAIHMLREADHIKGSKWARQLRALASLEQSANVFKRFGVTKAVHGHILAVDKTYRGHGIGQTLLVKAMERARQLGFPLYTTDCTSTFSARLCEKLGMDCVNDMKYIDYREPNSDQQIFYPPKNQPSVRTFAKRLL